MRLVIEREGGFTVIESGEAITEIDVRSDAVVLTIEVGGDKWTKELPVSGHAEACRVSAAIAVKCGELVEPLSEQSEVDVEAAMGAASAALVRERSRPWKAASEWARGEPPKNGMTYVAREGVNSLCVRWDGERWRTGGMPVVFGAGVVHLPASEWVDGEPPRSLGQWVDGEPPRSLGQWVAGEPPKGGLWYVVTRAGAFGCVAWDGNRFRDWFAETVLMGGEVAHLPTPVPSRR